jgi:acyl-CoA thioesterase II
MDPFLGSLIAQLDLEPLELNLFRGQSADLGGRSVFGGQVVGQALVAAARTAEDRVAHSLHAYFLLPGDMTAPIVYEVDRIRDGRSFSARRVQAIQHGRPILSMIASFHVDEPGLDHQAQMPEVPAPEVLRPMHELREEWLSQAGEVPDRLREMMRRPPPIEFRPIEPWNPLKPTPAKPSQACWFKTVDKVPDSPILHRSLLAYASDYNLLPTALLPHGRSWLSGRTTEEPASPATGGARTRAALVVASLDHAMWFHRRARIDEWLLYVMDSPSAQGARGLARGLIFDRGGALVASVAQEGLMREATR